MEEPRTTVDGVDSDFTVSDDDFDLNLPSPDALARELDQLRPPSDDDQMHVDLPESVDAIAPAVVKLS